MPDKRRYLAITLDGAGNWPPLRELFRELVQRGHDVRVISDAKHANEISAIGAHYRPYQFAPQQILARYPFSGDPNVSSQGEMLFAVNEIFLNPVYGRELLTEVERDTPDALLVDFLLMAASSAAESTKLPTVNLIHTVYGAFMSGFNPPPGPAVDQFTRHRKELGVPSISPPTEVLRRCAAMLAFTFEAFDVPTPDTPQHLHYVGPLGCLRRAAPRYDLPWPTDDQRPLVVVSFSTSFQNQGGTLQTVADAVASLPVRALITLGNAISAENLKLPANVVAVPFVPHSAVIPRAQLVITHAGHGTVMEAALAGIPLLCVPMGRDQYAVAACVERCGIGASMPATASASELKHEIDRLLNDERLRARCAQFARSLNLDIGLHRAMDALDCI